MQPFLEPETGEAAARTATLSDVGPPGVVEALVGRALWLRDDTTWPRPWQQSLAPEHRVAATYFLLDLSNDGVERFVADVLPRLLQQLVRSSERQRVEYRGRIRGPVLWPETLKARSTDEPDPSRFVCREVRNRFDTPENQLLKFVMEGIRACLTAVPDALRCGVCLAPARGGPVVIQTAHRLGRMETAMEGLWHNIRLREITTPERINEIHLVKAKTARLEEYGIVARLYERYAKCVLSPSWRSLAQIGHGTLPLPKDVGPAAEPWLDIGAAVLVDMAPE